MRADRTFGFQDRDRHLQDGLKGAADVEALSLAADEHRYRLQRARARAPRRLRRPERPLRWRRPRAQPQRHQALAATRPWPRPIAPAIPRPWRLPWPGRPRPAPSFRASLRRRAQSRRPPVAPRLLLLDFPPPAPPSSRAPPPGGLSRR